MNQMNLRCIEMVITMPECDNCGSWVSEDYKRVFEDNRGVLRACAKCQKLHGLDPTKNNDNI